MLLYHVFFKAAYISRGEATFFTCDVTIPGLVSMGPQRIKSLLVPVSNLELWLSLLIVCQNPLEGCFKHLLPAPPSQFPIQQIWKGGGSKHFHA